MVEGPRDPSLAPSSLVPVLIVSNRRQVREMVKLTLAHGRYVAREARSAAEAMRILNEWAPRIVVLDMDSDGDVLVRIGRSSEGGGTRIPVLALAHPGDLKTTLLAFEQGVDDVVDVTFAPAELLARLLVITRRSLGMAAPLTTTLRLGEVEIDILNRHVRVGSSEQQLTGVEQSLLYLFVANAGRVLSRDEILDALWGMDFVAESNVVDRHIRSLRAKLHDNWQKPRFIATVRGQGYRFLLSPANQRMAS